MKTLFKSLHQVSYSLRLNTSIYRKRWQFCSFQFFRLHLKALIQWVLKAERNTPTIILRPAGKRACIICRPSAFYMYCSDVMCSQSMNWRGKHMYISAQTRKQTRKWVSCNSYNVVKQGSLFQSLLADVYICRYACRLILSVKLKQTNYDFALHDVLHIW